MDPVSERPRRQRPRAHRRFDPAGSRVAGGLRARRVRTRLDARRTRRRPARSPFRARTDEVVELLALCNEAGVAVVPSGGRTGLAGGAVAAHGEIVLSLSRMRRMDPVDVLGGTVRVQAGAITEAVHQHCAPHGLTWPVDFASKGSSTVGGNIATNAGGVKVIRYGLTRQWVLGLEVVLAIGRRCSSSAARSRRTTPASTCASSSSAARARSASITEATLKLTRAARRDARRDALRRRRRRGGAAALPRGALGPFTLAAYEFFTQTCLDRVLRTASCGRPSPSRASYYVLLEVEGDGATEADSRASSRSSSRGSRASSSAGSRRTARWRSTRRRRASSGRCARASARASAPPGCRTRTTSRCRSPRSMHSAPSSTSVFAQRYPGWEICLFGHIGDGNLHVNVMKPDAHGARRVPRARRRRPTAICSRSCSAITGASRPSTASACSRSRSSRTRAARPRSR